MRGKRAVALQVRHELLDLTLPNIVKVAFITEQDMKAQRGSRGKVLLFLWLRR